MSKNKILFFQHSILIQIFSLLFFSSCSYDAIFFAVNKQNVKAKMAQVKFDENYVFSKDGRKIYTVHFKPENEIKGSLFFLQGSGDNIASWSHAAKYFVDAGFEVIMMEYRGFGKDSLKATHENAVTDASLVFSFYINSGYLKSDKLILLGQSYGGQLAINLAYKFSYKVAALITEGTFTSFNDEVVYNVPFYLKPFIKITTASPYKSKQLIKNIRGVPVLVIHSKDDTTVPFRMGEKLFENANETKSFWQIQGKHIHGIEDYTSEYINRIMELIKK